MNTDRIVLLDLRFYRRQSREVKALQNVRVIVLSVVKRICANILSSKLYIVHDVIEICIVKINLHHKH